MSVRRTSEFFVFDDEPDTREDYGFALSRLAMVLREVPARYAPPRTESLRAVRRSLHMERRKDSRVGIYRGISRAPGCQRKPRDRPIDHRDRDRAHQRRDPTLERGAGSSETLAQYFASIASRDRSLMVRDRSCESGPSARHDQGSWASRRRQTADLGSAR